LETEAKELKALSPLLVGPRLPLSLEDTAQARQIEEAKTVRRTFGTPAPKPILMAYA
jgi:hypothetical protein